MILKDFDRLKWYILILVWPNRFLFAQIDFKQIETETFDDFNILQWLAMLSLNSFEAFIICKMERQKKKKMYRIIYSLFAQFGPNQPKLQKHCRRGIADPCKSMHLP